MKALVYENFNGPLWLKQAADPVASPDGVVIAVRATGVCRSDWHGWQGHDADIKSLPHVPGHEFAGVIVEVGRDVAKWRVGDRVTMPFVAGCGQCPECREGAPQVCDAQFQPGFTAWGSFAEAVAVRYADFNLVRLPESLEFVTAAALGCRLATAYRAVAIQGRAAPDEWVAVFGCGGVGLSAIMIAKALGARPIAIDVRAESLAMAQSLGAEHAINAATVADPAAAIGELTGRGAHLSLDALGSGTTAANSLRSLRKRGRHVQVGLLAGSEFQPRLPMELVIGRELEIYGSHGLAAADYAKLLALVASGKLDPRRLVHRTISLAEAPAALAAMGSFGQPGITVIAEF
ncbi:zinc-dependent alcohol dehydrogenase family protein [Lacipirellula limnantheis]|uniref:Alcohol dehydrogenase n=1 Tax=Lacipirellula limnantheis TaxID=2528024 RepID=A0A517TVJ5_9BACT|nr:zinc-dependent alcohol dehydrogenase family protein [Lacipirellula limnantheis]QDT72384.1 Alcohol dehydrogenase [Lacipirellula limnantheis]